MSYKRFSLVMFLLVIITFSSCYLRPADEPPTLSMQKDTKQMAYETYADVTYTSEIGFEYWEILSEQGKMFYDAMWHFTLTPCISYEPNLYHFSPADEYDRTAFYDASRFLVLDHPEKELLQFMDMSSYYYSESENYRDFALGSFVDKTDYEKKISEIEQATSPLIQQVNAEPVKKEKYRMIHDWIVSNVKYDYLSYLAVVNADSEIKIDPSINNLYGALVNHLAVCDGISDAFKYLCNQCQLECITVQGHFENEKTADGRLFGHQWNLVYDENTWSLVDCTFDLEIDDHYSYFMVSPQIDSRTSWYSLDY